MCAYIFLSICTYACLYTHIHFVYIETKQIPNSPKVHSWNQFVNVKFITDSIKLFPAHLWFHRERDLTTTLSRGPGSTSMLLFLFLTQRAGKTARPWSQLQHCISLQSQPSHWAALHTAKAPTKDAHQEHTKIPPGQPQGWYLPLVCSETGETRSNSKLAYQTMLQQNHSLPWQSTETAIYFSEALPHTPSISFKGLVFPRLFYSHNYQHF